MDNSVGKTATFSIEDNLLRFFIFEYYKGAEIRKECERLHFSFNIA